MVDKRQEPQPRQAVPEQQTASGGPSTASVRVAAPQNLPAPQASWWRLHRGVLGRDALVGLVAATVLALGGLAWDSRIAARQNKLASDIADRQDRLAREQADRAEVLENLRFVRQLVVEDKVMKPFSGLRLVGADLEGLDRAVTATQGGVRAAPTWRAQI